MGKGDRGPKPGEGGAKARRREASPGKREPSPGGGRKPYVKILLALGATGVGILLLAGIGLLLVPAPEPPYPNRDHWHAKYAVEVCGKALPPFPYSQGDVHTHGDGVIHVHPSSPATAGRNANLGAFFRSVRMEVLPGYLRLPDGKTYRDGDLCPDGKPGRVAVLINGKSEPDFLAHVVRDGEEVKVVFR